MVLQIGMMKMTAYDLLPSPFTRDAQYGEGDEEKHEAPTVTGTIGASSCS